MLRTTKKLKQIFFCFWRLLFSGCASTAYCGTQKQRRTFLLKLKKKDCYFLFEQQHNYVEENLLDDEQTCCECIFI
jgi:hypothetical protein